MHEERAIVEMAVGERSVGESRFLFMDLKTTSLIMDYLLMLTHAGIIMIDYLTNKEYNFPLIFVNDTDLPEIIALPFVDTTLLLAMGPAIISFVVVLLLGLYMDYRSSTIDLPFSFFFITISVIYCVMWEYVFFVNPTTTLYRVLIVAINSVFLYVIRCLWTNLKPDDRRLEEHA